MNDNKKIAVNSVIIFVRLVVTSLIGIFSSRIVLDALGASDYGLNNVVGGIIGMLGVFNTAMLSTTYRYVAAELGRKEQGNLNKVFNISMMIHAGFAILILVLGLTVGLWYVNNYLNVEPGKLDDARFVFFVSIAVATIGTVFVPFSGLLTAYEKFGFLAIKDIVIRLLYLVAFLLFLYSDGNRLRIYAIIQLVIVLLNQLVVLLFCHKSFSDVVHIKLYKDFKLVKEMFSFAVWILFGAVSSIFKTQGSNIMINFFFGTVVNAAYAVANSVDGIVNTFARSLNSAAVPQITKSMNGGNEGRSITLTCYISKYTFILMAVVAFPAMLEMDFLLGIWLKDVPEGAAMFSRLLILAALIGTLGEGIPALVAATGRIRAFQLIFYTVNLLGLPVAFIAYKSGASQYTVAEIYCIIAFLEAFLRLFILKKFYKFDIMQIVKISYVRILYIVIPLAVYFLLYNPEWFSSAWGHIGGMCVSEVFLLIFVVLLGLDSKERQMAKQFLNSKIKTHQ